MTSIGSLFTGYGGLDMAVQQTLGGDVAWYSEIDKAACTTLEAHHPGVRNLGDITTVDWADVPSVDILTGGFPCQPFSHAGKRKGTKDERHLWPYCVQAVAALTPKLAVFENVMGLLSIKEDMDGAAGEARGRRLGGRGDGPVQRYAFLTVLQDLAEVGYDARWGTVRAADAGAPHGRARVFIAAYPHGSGLEGHDFAALLQEGQGRRGADRSAAQGDQLAAADTDGGGHGGEQDAGGVGGVDDSDAGAPRQRQRAWAVADAGSALVDWKQYEPAIRRWEQLTRPAPAPTVPGPNGKPRLSPLFVEWMMDLPVGHVTGHGLRPAACLKQLGNGVVPGQASLALRLLLGLPAVGVAATEKLLPPPRVSDTNGAGLHGTGGPDLRTAVSLLQDGAA